MMYNLLYLLLFTIPNHSLAAGPKVNITKKELKCVEVLMREKIAPHYNVIIYYWGNYPTMKPYSKMFYRARTLYGGVMKFHVLDVTHPASCASALGIEAVPTTLLFRSGRLIRMFEGIPPEGTFMQMIEKHLDVVKK